MLDASDSLGAGMAYRLTLVVLSDVGRAVDIRAWRTAEGRLAGLPAPSLLVVLTAEHNDPARFCQAMAHGVSPITGPVPVSGLSLEDGVVVLLNAVAEATETRGVDVALVICGYQAIRLTDIHEALALMLDYLPPKLHVFIITTSVPPLANIPRLRARRQLLELSV
jgi:LuxR family transcriptional regulator, maltose regulon positive regulatory protein